MAIVDILISGFQDLMGFLGELLHSFGSFLFDILGAPLQLLLELLMGIFYFFMQFMTVLSLIIRIFTGLFQLFFSYARALFSTIFAFTNFSSYGSISPDDQVRTGMNVFYELLEPYGVMTTLPNVINALLWIFFTLNIIGLIGHRGQIKGTWGVGGGYGVGMRSDKEMKELFGEDWNS